MDSKRHPMDNNPKGREPGRHGDGDAPREPGSRAIGTTAKVASEATGPTRERAWFAAAPSHRMRRPEDAPANP